MSIFASPRFLPRVMAADAISCAATGALQLGFADEMAILREVLTPQLFAQVEAMMAMPTMSPAAAFLERHRRGVQGQLAALGHGVARIDH